MNYQQVIYGSYKPSDYSKKLSEYLLCNIMFPTSAEMVTYPEIMLPPIIKDRKVSILDVGCGDGTYVKEFLNLGFQSNGIDSNVIWQYNNILDTVYQTDNLNGLSVQIDFNKDELGYPDNSFDFVFCKSVIEHVANTDHFLRQIYRVLKPGGKAILLLPAWEFNYRWFYDDPTHVKPFHRKGLHDALRLADFKEVNVKYFYHLPFMWKFPILGKFITKLIRLLPDDWRWKDWNQQHMNVLIRFSKETQLLGICTK